MRKSNKHFKEITNKITNYIDIKTIPGLGLYCNVYPLVECLLLLVPYPMKGVGDFQQLPVSCISDYTYIEGTCSLRSVPNG